MKLKKIKQSKNNIKRRMIQWSKGEWNKIGSGEF